MRGHPKYTYGDIVRFKINYRDENDNILEEIKEGVIAIIDYCGTFFDGSDVSYDILVKSENRLYKHFKEATVIEKVGQISKEEIWKEWKI